MPKYMLIETFSQNSLEKTYERLHEKGRMLPEGLAYIDSWLTADGSRCFQMMETDNYGLLQEWMKNWSDLVKFEIYEIGVKPGKNGRA